MKLRIQSLLCTACFAAALCVLGYPANAQTDAQRAVIETLHRGRDAMQKGDLPQAEILFRQAASAAPDLSDAHLALGLVQLRRGEGDAAVQSLTRATELNLKLPGARLFLGIALYQTGQADRAADSLQGELASAPDNVEALTWLGIVQLGRGRADEAIAPLDRAAHLAPHNVELLYYQGRAHMLVATEAYRQLSELDPDSALVHRGMAESLEIAGQTEKAISEYEAAIRKDAANPDLYEALGEANLKMSRIDAARLAYERELALSPASGIALYNLGRLDVEQAKPQEGIELLRKAVAAHVRAAPADFYLGLGLAKLGRDNEAAHWFEQSLAAAPSAFIERDDWFQLTRVYARLNRKADAQHAQLELKRILDEQQIQKSVSAKSLVDTTQTAPASASGSAHP